jgi:transposase
MTAAEREELARLRRENRQLRQERDILAKGRHWSAIGPSDTGDAWFAAAPNRRTS